MKILEFSVMEIGNNIYWFHKLIFKEWLPIWKTFSSSCWSFKMNSSCKRSHLWRLNIKLKNTPRPLREKPSFTLMNYTFFWITYWCCSKKLQPSAVCASIINTEIIVLTKPFYHQEILIQASEKNLRCTALQKSCTENDFYTCGRRSFYPPSLVNFCCAHIC